MILRPTTINPEDFAYLAADLPGVIRYIKIGRFVIAWQVRGGGR